MAHTINTKLTVEQRIRKNKKNNKDDIDLS